MARSQTWNAYETNLAGPLGIGATTVAVDSSLGLVAPVYLVLDPDDPSKREWIRVNTINANTFENIVRNLQGSVGDIAHDSGAKVRAVFAKQHLDDLFDDIETNSSDLAVHVADGGDPHAAAQYLKLSQANGLYVEIGGDTMSGPLTLFGAPTVDLHASTKLYVDVTVAAQDHDHATPIAAHDAGSAHTAAFADKLDKAGDTMTGDLVMSGAVVDMPQNFAFQNEGDGSFTAPAGTFQEVVDLVLPEAGTWMVWSSLYFADSVGGSTNIEYVAALFQDDASTVIDTLHVKHNMPDMGPNMFMAASPNGVYQGVTAGQSVRLRISRSLATGAQDFKTPHIMALRIGP